MVLVKISRLLGTFKIVTRLLFIVKAKIISFSGFPGFIFLRKYNIYRDILVPVINISALVIREVLLASYEILAIWEFWIKWLGSEIMEPNVIFK